MENRKHHAETIFPLVVLLGLLTVGCSAQNTPSETDVAFGATAQADARAAATIRAEDKATFQAKYPLQTPTPTPYKMKRSTPLNCGTVAAENGSVLQALADAYDGNIPPAYDADGYTTQVQIDHKDPSTLTNMRYLLTLLQVLQKNPDAITGRQLIVAPGDKVCFSSDVDRLNQVPVPTPGPYITPTPQAMRQNNMTARSFAVTLNKAPVFTRRG